MFANLINVLVIIKIDLIFYFEMYIIIIKL